MKIHYHNLDVLTKIIFIFIFLASTHLTLSFAQNVPSIQWQKCLGGSDNEDPDNNARNFCIVRDGGYVIAHRTHSQDFNVAGSFNHGQDDAWIVKMNSLGSIQWQKCLGGSSTDDAYSIINTSDNGYVMAGWTASNDGDVSGQHNFNKLQQNVDAWVVKLDSIGNIQWSKCYGGSRSDFATSIIETSDGGYAFTGHTNSDDGDVSGNHIGIDLLGKPDTTEDIWVVKLSSSGSLEWQNCLGGTGAEVAYSIIQTTDGGYAIAGITNSKEEGFPNYGLGDAYIVKLTSSGGFQWQQIYGDSLQDGATSILQSSDGGFIFGGYTNSTIYDFSRPRKGDFWIVKLDTIGRGMWQKSYGGSNWSFASSIIKTAEGGYATVGTSYANDRDIKGNHGNSDACVFKLTSSGIVEWQKSLGGSSADFGYTILQTPDGGYAINGCTYSNDGDVSGNHSVFSLDPSLFPIDVWFVKLSPESNSVENSNGGETHFLNAFPNPASDQIHLQLSGSLTLKQVSFYNLMGTQYFPEYKLEQSVATVDVHTLPSGSFVARIVYQDSHQNYLEQVQKFLHYR